MKAGRLRNRVRIERSTRTTDATGAPIKVWQLVVERDCGITFVSAREFFSASTEVNESTVRIVLREVPEIRLDGVLRAVDVDTDAVYDITAVLPSPQGNDITLAAKAGGARQA